MAKKEFIYRGFKLDELKTMSPKEFSEIAPARARRSIKRGMTEAQKSLMTKIDKKVKDIKTHCRDMVILPVMVGLTIKIHTGKVFHQVLILPEMIGHFLGEYALTRKRMAHSSPGVGATKSSSSVSVK